MSIFGISENNVITGQFRQAWPLHLLYQHLPNCGNRYYLLLAGTGLSRFPVIDRLGRYAQQECHLWTRQSKPLPLTDESFCGIPHGGPMLGGSLFNEQVMALRMINTRVGRVTAENISSVYIRPKQEAEVWFVPLKKGTYSFFAAFQDIVRPVWKAELRLVINRLQSISPSSRSAS